MRTIQEIENELNMKEQRVSYWEKFGIVPSMNELVLFNDPNMEVGA